ncbi:MAG: hypothetical protein Q4G51_14540 [Dermatophilus congolensis]|nr:hypothetical protein [Dermatophilus congolensis]
MPVADYGTVSEARREFKSLLDAAADGGAGVVRRDTQRFAVVDAEALWPMLVRSVGATPELFFEDDSVGIALPGAPLAAEGETLEEAAQEMIAAMREYAGDWPQLRHAPNHQRHRSLVTLIDIASDEQLMDWLTGKIS